ncbi:FKBP-type peptidyl-prolyl cis-trans isomerase [Solitalea lacus]|uniref:FKBP-type peptidyl-prolyl cis-trans isomerase n=1 Tax=Solitalea lacus TaxID=2911172 RepID=UPI001EDAD2F5|nr:FKBP-type peptidyl-prolyl cis-trans isomerase [Solitalea lacus]UKJ07196.1 FKBP-type peptidyl-prolyl cis-trans isomerase [Solitalea lacus]
MKNLLLLPLLAFVLLISCKKDDYDPLQQQRDEQRKFDEQLGKDTVAIQGFLKQKELPYIRTSSGVYYNIVQPGTGNIIYNAGTRVQVKFRALLLDGTVVDESTINAPATYTLGDLIAGFQIGIPLIQPGGKIILYVPSGYVFGERTITDGQGKTLAPANSNFIFELELLQAI